MVFIIQGKKLIKQLTNKKIQQSRRHQIEKSNSSDLRIRKTISSRRRELIKIGRVMINYTIKFAI